MTVRSEGQFNTVVYEDEDIYRGQERRDVILMNERDIARLGLHLKLVRAQQELLEKNAELSKLSRTDPRKSGSVTPRFGWASMVMVRRCW